ncbi:MAG: DNA sulfur modification protein DndB [Myxacorys californica WJT36-NPBG1]|jgi:DNA sulfur modification protein DndB|nr:DNA sulfur modification protein DndB [Myxacorys californica WJT36-NPBG1]
MELVLPAVAVRRGPEGNQISYVASFTFGDIARLLDDGRLYVPNQPDLPDFAQRKPNPVRIKAIAQYILETYREGTTFFPPICVNVQPPPTYRNGNVYLPYHSVTLRLTDGQHRCFGIRQAIQDIQTQDLMNLGMLSNLELGALLYSGLRLDLERQAFRDQNLLAQRPGTSLAYLFDKRSPSVLIAKSLMERVAQFQGNVETIENGLGQHNPKLMTLSTLVMATQHMFPNLRSKKDLEERTDWAVAFWIAAGSNFFNELWALTSVQERKRQREQSVAVSAIVFQALGLLARDLYLEGVSGEDLHKWLVKLGEIDWRRENNFWLERGVTQVGAQGNPILPNTRTTIDACHRVLREFVGIIPLSSTC